ncbi:MAG TPA: 2-oxo acid dehydrogenase subunit E2, partial [Terriglobia bacterium]|nr:2-oxo acid dehydrogenase subunit E2 [Terriglobia bacterium]
MAMEIRLPALGENIDSATVTKVLVKIGQSITKDQPILELDTEKASVDVPAPQSGTVKEIRVKEGDTLNVGQVVLTLEESGAGAAPSPPSPSPGGKKAQPAKPPAAKAEPEQSLTIESKQPSTPPPAPSPPSPPPQPAQPAQPAPQVPEPSAEGEALEKVQDASSQEGVPAAPSLRRMARELGIDIHAVAGTGPNGWITKEDVRNYARSIILNATVTDGGRRTSVLPDFSRWGAVERKAMSSIRRAIADHLHDAWSSIPHVTLFVSADITELEKFREATVAKAQSGQPKMTVTAIAVKVVSAALKVFPQFNSSLDPDREEVIYKKYCHIGVAVDT